MGAVCELKTVLLVLVLIGFANAESTMDEVDTRGISSESEAGKIGDLEVRVSALEDRVQLLEEQHMEPGEQPSLPPGECVPKLILQSDGSGHFDRNWAAFKRGFGYLRGGNYWLGLDEIHRLTATGRYKLLIELYSQRWYYAEYSIFRVGNESTNYRLTVRGFNGTAIYDAFGIHHNRMEFSTYDRDNDRYEGNCASVYEGGFWYDGCMRFSPTANGSVGPPAFAWWYLEGSISGWVKLAVVRMTLQCNE